MDSLSTRVEFEIQPYTRYYWKVIVTTDVEEVIESDVQFFETAKMDEPWTGRWITCDSSQERHPIFSKRIEPKKEEKKSNMSEAQRELELEKANAAKSKAKAGSMAAKANMVRDFNEKNSRK